jgi:hypothetical protein
MPRHPKVSPDGLTQYVHNRLGPGEPPFTFCDETDVFCSLRRDAKKGEWLRMTALAEALGESRVLGRAADEALRP